MLPWLTILRPLNLLQAGLAVLLTMAILGVLDQVQTLLLLLGIGTPYLLPGR